MKIGSFKVVDTTMLGVWFCLKRRPPIPTSASSNPSEPCSYTATTQ
jgi:hypothetical protein